MEIERKLKGKYFEMDSDTNEREILIEIIPPVGENQTVVESKAIVVVDCSGSMCGSRINKANSILKTIYETNNVQALEVIKFGSTAQPPIIFSKEKGDKLTQIDADLGGTDFHQAMKVLLETLKLRSFDENYIVLFLSDGEASHPTEYYATVKEELKRINAPLLSVAISNNVDPEIMVNLANLHGDLGLFLVKDSQEDSEYMGNLIDILPIGLPIDELIIKGNGNNGVELLQREKFKRGTEVINFELQTKSQLSDLKLKATMEGKEFGFELTNVKETQSLEEKVQFINSFLLNRAKHIIGQFIIKELNKDDAKVKILKLREIFNRELGEDNFIQDIVEKHSNNGQLDGLDQSGRIKLKEFRQVFKNIILGTLTQFNQFGSIIESNDLRNALEAYSGKKVSSKFNQRLLQVAERNKGKAATSVEAPEILSYLNSDKKPLPDCVYWLQNPLEVEPDEIAQLDQREWVGQGALVNPGKTAALNPWNLEEVVFTPVKITNTSVELIRNKTDNPRKKAMLKGFEGEFNTSLPLLSPDEHQGAVRLLIQFMRRSSEAQKEISNIFTGSEDLFDPAMVNALYAIGTLSTLGKASIGLDYELAFRAFLTTVDQVLYQHGENKNSQAYWEDILNKLTSSSKPAEENLGDKKEEATQVSANDFIANKDPAFLPGLFKSFMPLLSTPHTYELSGDAIKKVFFKLFVRLVTEQSSGKYELPNLLGLSAEVLREEALKLIEVSEGKRVEIPLIEDRKNLEEVKLYTRKFFIMYSIHISIKEYLEENKLSFVDFYSGFLDKKLDIQVGRKVFERAFELSKRGFNEIIQEISGHLNPQKLIDELLIVACQNHTSKTHPMHDGNDIKRVLQAAETLENLNKTANDAKNTFVRNEFAKVLFKANKIMKTKMKIVKFANRAKKISKELPLERLRINLGIDELSFSGQSMKFDKPRKMFNYLKHWSLSENDLNALVSQPSSFFSKFDLEKWIQQHRGYLPGVGKVYPDLLKISLTCEDFTGKLRAALEERYLGVNDPLLKRDFTPNMKEFLPKFANHIWNENLLMQAIEELKGKGYNNQEMLNLLVEKLSEFKENDNETSAIRKGHIQVLLSELNL